MEKKIKDPPKQTISSQKQKMQNHTKLLLMIKNTHLISNMRVVNDASSKEKSTHNISPTKDEGCRDNIHMTHIYKE